MSTLEAILERYKKRGFKVAQRRTLKYGKRIFLQKEKGGFAGLLGGFQGVYIYYVDGDSDGRNITEFLKDYKKFYIRENFDTGDKGIFLCTGKFDRQLFLELKRTIIRDREIASTISTKSLPSKAAGKRKVVSETKAERKVRKERLSIRGLIRKIKRFQPPSKPKRERHLEDMLISHLRAFYPDITTQLTYERARIDAKIGNVGIEIKFRPSSSDFDRLYGQLEKYLKYLEHVIVVIGSERSKDATNNFKRRLKERGWLNKKVSIVTL